MQSKMVFKICERLSYSSFSVKELDVIVHKNHFLISPYSFLAILYTTSLANLVVEVGTRHCHQILLYRGVPSYGSQDAYPETKKIESRYVSLLYNILYFTQTIDSKLQNINKKHMIYVSRYVSYRDDCIVIRILSWENSILHRYSSSLLTHICVTRPR